MTDLRTKQRTADPTNKISKISPRFLCVLAPLRAKKILGSAYGFQPFFSRISRNPVNVSMRFFRMMGSVIHVGRVELGVVVM